MTSNDAVVITGIGHILPPAFDAALAAPDLHASPETPEITGFEVTEGAPAYGHEIPDFRFEEHLPHFKTYVDRTSALALAAARKALNDAGLLDANARPVGVDIGCAYGTTFGCLEAMGLFWKKIKNSNPKFAQPLVFTHGYANSPSSLLCIEYGLRGVACTFSGSFLSGLEAVQFAHDQIKAGSAECVLVGASESLTSAMHQHLFAEQLLSSDPKNISGIVPGEGAAFFVMESLKSAQARGKTPYATFIDNAVMLSASQTGEPNSNESDWLKRIAPLNAAAGKLQFLETHRETNARPGLARTLANISSSVSAPVNLEAYLGETFSISGIAAASFALEARSLKNRTEAATIFVKSCDPYGKSGILAIQIK